MQDFGTDSGDVGLLRFAFIENRDRQVVRKESALADLSAQAA